MFTVNALSEEGGEDGNYNTVEVDADQDGGDNENGVDIMIKQNQEAE